MGLVLKLAGLAGWREALAELQRRLGELFGRPEPRRQVGLGLGQFPRFVGVSSCRKGFP
jgi:hypothetical protein